MKNTSKILKSHFQYIIKEYCYILKVLLVHKELFLISILSSFKFLYYAGIKNLITKRIYSKYKNNYQKLVKDKMILSHDWFSNNITTWVKIFNDEKLADKKLEILEIGSYEGASAIFFLNFLKNSNLTCVETFGGSDEHNNIDFKKVKKNFNHNLSNLKGRLNLFEGTSKKFFDEKINDNLRYGIIYIDGSHHFDDVYNDAINSFSRLNVNGIIIFDDFLKKYYKDLKKDPIVAILRFINKHKKNIKILNVNYQLIIKKIN